MRTHVLQHVPYEWLGSIAEWLWGQQACVTHTRLFEAVHLPPVAGIDLRVVMGGPMSVNDEATHTWLKPEKGFISEAMARGVPVLGVCLGAQLIASALGMRVYRAPHKEIGWFPIEGIAHDTRQAFRFPASLEAFYWHWETFDLPAGAVHLVRSADCEHQAFQMGRASIGLQFHLEATPQGARDMLHHGADELVPQAFVQDARQILDAWRNATAP